MHYVYILESLAHSNHWYVGVTNDLRKRLAQHNTGDSVHTNKFKPWKVKNYFAFENRNIAENFEAYLKSKSGRAFSKRHFPSRDESRRSGIAESTER
ncbi:MAG: GIY-YIG nuclease family protein [Candidatus Peribacteraceae bacterium]